MIIRAPTRTKTKSFNGQQMGFKFPSTESLRNVTLDEYHLNNHHLLNDNVPKSSDDAASQILSDYTSVSNSNTNSGRSSNGYYSFANISDNTTASPKFGGTGKGLTSNSNDGSVPDLCKTPLLEPLSCNEEARSFSKSPSSPMEAIPEINGFSSFSTVFQSIPTAANISYDITSSVSSTKSKATVKSPPLRKASVRKLHRTPTMTRIRSTTSTKSLQSSSQEAITPKSKLKRSKAVRCKGGLLQYFILIGLKIKRQLRRFICSIRSKMGSRQRSRNSKSNQDVQKTRRSKNAARKASGTNDLTTSHLKRTQRYVNNLQRSMSCKSLQPVLMSKGNSASATAQQTQPEKPKKDITRNPTTSLRRTNSSIRRAASIITTSPGASSPIKKAPTGSPVTEEYTKSNSNGIRPGIVRSKGSKSLNSLARQPSIVVKNKVIPLSMHHYSIEEEDEDGDEYVISTNSMRPLSPVESADSDNESFVDVSEDVPCPEAEESKKLAQTFKHYLSAVIAHRIMIKLQIAKFQEPGSSVSYLDLFESIIREYETDTSTSDLFDSCKSQFSTTEEEEEEEEEEEGEDEEEERYDDFCTEAEKQKFKITVQSPFGSVTRLKHSESMISLSTRHVKRSLTLPIGIKV